jgi:hypothetical protein
LNFLSQIHLNLKYFYRTWNYTPRRFISSLQHGRPCCFRCCIRSRLRLVIVNLIQHGRSCCKPYIKAGPFVWRHWVKDYMNRILIRIEEGILFFVTCVSHLRPNAAILYKVKLSKKKSYWLLKLYRKNMYFQPAKLATWHAFARVIICGRVWFIFYSDFKSTHST